METMERRSSVFTANCEHISNVLIVDFEKMRTFEDKIGYIMRYVVVY